MSKSAIGNRQSAFGHAPFLLNRPSFLLLSCLLEVSCQIRPDSERLARCDLAECRMPNAECPVFVSPVANPCTVMLGVTSVTHRGLADSVLISVGKVLLERGF